MIRGCQQTFSQRRHTDGQQVYETAQHNSSLGKCKSKYNEVYFTPHSYYQNIKNIRGINGNGKNTIKYFLKREVKK